MLFDASTDLAVLVVPRLATGLRPVPLQSSRWGLFSHLRVLIWSVSIKLKIISCLKVRFTFLSTGVLGFDCCSVSLSFASEPSFVTEPSNDEPPLSLSVT